MKANEAAAKVVQGQYDKAMTQAAKVETCITKAIEDGRRTVSFDGKLEQGVERNLRQMGYAVTYSNDQRDGNYTTITW
jgi:hypothetical protein